jgi:hypothetical protein
VVSRDFWEVEIAGSIPAAPTSTLPQSAGGHLDRGDSIQLRLMENAYDKSRWDCMSLLQNASNSRLFAEKGGKRCRN